VLTWISSTNGLSGALYGLRTVRSNMGLRNMHNSSLLTGKSSQRQSFRRGLYTGYIDEAHIGLIYSIRAVLSTRFWASCSYRHSPFSKTSSPGTKSVRKLFLQDHEEVARSTSRRRYERYVGISFSKNAMKPSTQPFPCLLPARSGHCPVADAYFIPRLQSRRIV